MRLSVWRIGILYSYENLNKFGIITINPTSYGFKTIIDHHNKHNNSALYKTRYIGGFMVVFGGHLGVFYIKFFPAGCIVHYFSTGCQT